MEILCKNKIRSIYFDKSHDKNSRNKEIFGLYDSILLELTYENVSKEHVYSIFTRLVRDIINSLVLDDNRRIDSRDITEIRPISCEVDLHKPLHGSAIFQRGQTQVFCTVTLDSLESALKADPMSVLTGYVF